MRDRLVERSGLAFLPLTLCLALAGCPGDGSREGSASGPASTSSAREPAASAAPPHAPAAPTVATSGSEAPAPLLSGIASFAPIARHADPSVVTILTAGTEVEPSPFFSHRAVQRETQGLGTGFIVDKSGVILTNNHVIKDADVITVRLSNEHEYPAKIVGRDRATDVAVVKIDEKNLVPLSLGDSDTIDVGDWVVAIGNPFGLSHTVSAGIISAKGRNRQGRPARPDRLLQLPPDRRLDQPGQLGRPAPQPQGRGRRHQHRHPRRRRAGIGFAIPINMVKQLLPMLLRDGHVTRSALGVRILDVARQLPRPTGRRSSSPTTRRGRWSSMRSPTGRPRRRASSPGTSSRPSKGRRSRGARSSGRRARRGSAVRSRSSWSATASPSR